jgi:uncharacterized damage-inducible protein DinB
MGISALSPDTTRILRHLVATIAYRSSHSLRDAPAGFQDVRLAEGSMTAGELVFHITQVLSFALAVVNGTERVRYEALDWPQEVARFYAMLGELDASLASGARMEDGMDLRLVQGPLADALTHVGQLHAMRRKAGAPIAPTNYIKANVQAGRTTLQDQSDVVG